MIRFLFIISFIFTAFISIGFILKPVDVPVLEYANKIEVYKKDHLLKLFDKNGDIIKNYKIALGFNPIGHKEQEGDGKTPEGIYKIDFRKHSKRFYKSLRISYPNEQDKLKAKDKSISPGGDIMIHGVGKHFWFLKNIHKLFDWTQGCIAVNNDEIDEIWALVKDGTTIEILP